MAPSSGPRTRSSGTASRPITCTSSPRMISAAATSSPMNDEPITMAHPFALAMIARLSSSVRSRCACAMPGISSRTGVAPVVSRIASNACGPPSRIKCLPSSPSTASRRKAMSVFGEVLRRPQRDPVLRRRSGQVVLRQVRPIHRRGRLRREQGDRALVSFAPQHLRCRRPRRASPDDGDGSRPAGNRS